MAQISIITINKNNANGLKKTIESIKQQTNTNIEHIIIDGNSSDDSVSIIKEYHDKANIKVVWISEPDSGIYSAMNKGIRLSTGKYLQFLNSGDILCNGDVAQVMSDELESKQTPPILYGNMIKAYPNGTTIKDMGFQGKKINFFDMFSGTLNHSSAIIYKQLFEQHGYYDESFRIVSDWIWYYKVILEHKIDPVYVNIDVSTFDMTGISNTNHKLEKEERSRFLKTVMPEYIYDDYKGRAYSIKQINRIQTHNMAWKCFNILDTITKKIENVF